MRKNITNDDWASNHQHPRSLTFHDPAGVTLTRMNPRRQKHIRTILCTQQTTVLSWL